MRWIVLLFGLWAGAAAAQSRGEASIAAFYGRWVGSGLSESALSQAFRLTKRDFDVEVQPEGDGFRVTWTAVLRQKGDPLQPDVVRRQSTLVFRPTGTPSLWRGADNADPITGKPYAWARMERQTLVITLMELDAAGKWQMQVWRRTLSDLGMKLDYTRLAEGDPVRSTQGRLTKFRN
jgi:hypothetical protein